MMLIKICGGIGLCYIEVNFGPQIKQGESSVNFISFWKFNLHFVYIFSTASLDFLNWVLKFRSKFQKKQFGILYLKFETFAETATGGVL